MNPLSLNLVGSALMQMSSGILHVLNQFTSLGQRNLNGTGIEKSHI